MGESIVYVEARDRLFTPEIMVFVKLVRRLVLEWRGVAWRGSRLRRWAFTLLYEVKGACLACQTNWADSLVLLRTENEMV